MGPKASTPAETSSQQQLKINHPIFAIAKLIRDKQDQLFVKTQVRLPNKTEFDSWSKRLSEVPANDSLMLPVSHYYTEEGLCGNSGTAHITFDNFPYLLSDQITNRECLNKKLFEENQLWYLVYTLLSAAFTYHRQGAKVGDIRPDNIFINEDGQVKVASVDSWPGEQTNYAKAFYEKQTTYLSPEQIKDYQFGKMEESVDKELAQTFSIGLTCLDAATLSESKSLYSKNFKFSYEKLDQRLAEFRKYGYSELLTLTIENICEVDTEFRSSSRQILQWLLPYEEAIINLEDFQVNGLPEKMKLARDRHVQTSSIHSQSTHFSSAFVQPSTYAVNSSINAPTFTVPPPSAQLPQYTPPPMQFRPVSNFQQPVHIQYVNQPATYVQQISHEGETGHILPPQNYYAMNSTTVNSMGSNIVSEAPKFNLEHINQQLEESRRLFPQ